MTGPKELERIGGLFNLASKSSRPFLIRCSETKYLAVRDYNRATNVTVELAKQTLREANSGLIGRAEFRSYLTTLQNAFESGMLDNNVIKALENLRTKYLEKVLRPAIQTYFQDNEQKTSEIELLYNDALRIEALLEVVQFLKKIKPVI